MPEGPEIKRAADKLARILMGRKPRDIFFAFDHLKSYENDLRGDRIVSVRSRSKAMLIGFEQGLPIYSHHQLYGQWRTSKSGHLPDIGRQLRLALHTDKHSALLYSASDIEVLDKDGLQAHKYLCKLGIEVLSLETTPEDIKHQLSSDTFRRRRLAGLLLDQKCLAGLGNYLRSEILFVAGLRAEQRPMDLSEAQLDRLSHAALDITRRAYRTGGVTVEDVVVAKIKEGGRRRRWEYRHYVFGRDGSPCRRCGDTIVRSDAAGRRCYHCPTCQPA